MRRFVHIVFVLLLVFYSLDSIAQKADTLYFTPSFVKTTKKWAAFYRVYQKDNNVYRFRSYYMNDSLHMKGAVLSIEPEMKHGFFTRYDSTGHAIFKGSYRNNKLEGKVSFYAKKTGKQLLEMTFENDTANGPAIVFDTATGMKAATGLVLRNWRDGEWLFYYYKSDKVFASYYYTDGARNGHFAWFHRSGNKMAEGFFSGGRVIGDFTGYYDKPGVVSEKSYFEFGYAEGLEHKYDSATGNITWEGLYISGKREGKWVYFYPDKKNLGFDTYKNGLLDGESESYYRSGKKKMWGSFKFGVASGKRVSYYEDESIKTIEEFVGSRTYQTYTYYDSATRKVITKGEVQSNSKVGQWYRFEPGTDIVIEKVQYKNGKEDGAISLFYNDGSKRLDGQHEDGERSGKWTYYHKGSGNIWIKQQHDKGHLNNELLVYYENGELKRKEFYRNDSLVDYHCYTETGHDTAYTPFFSKASFEEDVSTFIGKELRYPEVSRLQGVEGKVVVEFVVNEDGSITEATVTQGLNDECDKEAIRIITAMPKWTPAQVEGQTFKETRSVPIVFWIPEKTNG